MKTVISFVGSLLVLASVGCGNVNDKPIPGENFVGVWRYTTGNATEVCGGNTASGDIQGNEEIRFGADSDLVLISDDGCDIRLSLADDVARVIPGQTCTSKTKGSDGQDVTKVYSFPQYEFSISKDGKSMNGDYTVGINISSSGYSESCTTNATGVLTKVSKD